jgi:hypothetical protein
VDADGQPVPAPLGGLSSPQPFSRRSMWRPKPSMSTWLTDVHEPVGEPAPELPEPEGESLTKKA